MGESNSRPFGEAYSLFLNTIETKVEDSDTLETKIEESDTIETKLIMYSLTFHIFL